MNMQLEPIIPLTDIVIGDFKAREQSLELIQPFLHVPLLKDKRNLSTKYLVLVNGQCCALLSSNERVTRGDLYLGLGNT